MSDVTAIGRLLILSDNVPLDGRISWAAEGASGSEPHNKYLLLGQDRALLIDTGVAAHEQSFLRSLERALGARKLVILLTRNELDCIGNLGPLLDWRPESEVVTTNSLPVVGLVHLARTDRTAVRVRRCPPGSDLADLGFPEVKVVAPVVRLLGTGWVLDQDGGTLFSSDFFGVEPLASPGQGLVRDNLDRMPEVGALRSGILAKFEWLRRADAPMVLDKWDRFFAGAGIKTLAPSHGRLCHGEAIVDAMVGNYRAAVASASEVGREAQTLRGEVG